MKNEDPNFSINASWVLPADRSLNMDEQVDLWASCARISPSLRTQTEDDMIKAIIDNYNDMIKSLLL